MINIYKFNETEVLVYGDNIDITVDEHTELIAENVNPDNYPDLPIVSYKAEDMKRDRKLELEGISTYNDLSNAYFLTRTKELRKPKQIRDWVIEKYQDICDVTSIVDYGTK